MGDKPKRIVLSKENWAELRELEEVSERKRRPIASTLAQLSQEGMQSMRQMALLTNNGKKTTELDLAKLAKLNISFSERDLELFNTANDYCILALVSAWSFALPIEVDSILDLTAPDYDVLKKECAPAVQTLFVDFEMTKEAVGDPTSPFGRSNGSSSFSKAGKHSTSASRSRSGGRTSS